MILLDKLERKSKNISNFLSLKVNRFTEFHLEFGKQTFNQFRLDFLRNKSKMKELEKIIMQKIIFTKENAICKILSDISTFFEKHNFTIKFVKEFVKEEKIITKKYKYVSNAERKTKRVSAIILIIVIGISSVLPVIISLFRFPHRNENTTDISVSYLNPDTDFGTIDYSSIAYFLDGVEYFLPSNGMLSYIFNDAIMHNFTGFVNSARLEKLMWNGEIHEILFNSSISRQIDLTTMSILSQVVWDELFINTNTTNIQLLWYNGISFVVVESGITDLSGMISFANLIAGTYIISELGDLDSETSFDITSSSGDYTSNVVLIPEKTIVNFVYEDSIFGANSPIDLSLWNVYLAFNKGATWGAIIDPVGMNFAVGYTEVGGTMTFYELIVNDLAGYRTVGYWGGANAFKLLDVVAFEGESTFTRIAKSGTFEFLWSSDSSPYANTLIELFADGVSVGMFMTDSSGVITLSEVLPIGVDLNWEGFGIFNFAYNSPATSKFYLLDSIFLLKSSILNRVGMGEIFKYITLRECDIYFFSFFNKITKNGK